MCLNHGSYLFYCAIGGVSTYQCDIAHSLKKKDSTKIRLSKMKRAFCFAMMFSKRILRKPTHASF